MFTSHSPYVLEEFGLNETVVLSRSGDGLLSQASVNLPESVKRKRYRQEFRIRFCEGLLSRRLYDRLRRVRVLDIVQVPGTGSEDNYFLDIHDYQDGHGASVRKLLDLIDITCGWRIPIHAAMGV